MMVAMMSFSQQVPDFKNTPMILKADGSLGKLEKQAATKRDKGGSNPWANAYTYGATANKTVEFVSITGLASDVVLPTNAQFIFKAASEDVDPEGVFILYKAVVTKKAREIYTRKDMGKDVKDAQVALNFEKVSPGVYKIIPEGLVAGTQYGFIENKNDAAQVYLFGTEGTAPSGKKDKKKKK